MDIVELKHDEVSAVFGGRLSVDDIKDGCKIVSQTGICWWLTGVPDANHGVRLRVVQTGCLMALYNGFCFLFSWMGA